MDILVALYILKDQVENGEIRSNLYGICHFLAVILCGSGSTDFSSIIDETIDFVDACSEGWDYHSNDLCFPLSEIDYIQSNGMYEHNMWGGECYKARLDLIDYMIKRIEEGDYIYE